jgi:hypothetical protein
VFFQGVEAIPGYSVHINYDVPSSPFDGGSNPGANPGSNTPTNGPQSISSSNALLVQISFVVALVMSMLC